MKFNRPEFLLPAMLLFILPVISFADTTPQGSFARGNAFYAKGDFKNADAAYQEVVRAGYQSAQLYLNMGNANYKLGEFTQAIWYFEKAHKLSPGDEDINFNIQLANLKTTDQIDVAPEFFLYKWWRSIILSCSLSTFVVISVALVFMGSALLILYFFSFSAVTKRTAFYGSIVLFITGLFTVYLGNRQQYYFKSNKAAIVFSNAVIVKSGPADNSATSFVIHDGTKVNVANTDNGWIKISLANGNEGWIKVSDVRMI